MHNKPSVKRVDASVYACKHTELREVLAAGALKVENGGRRAVRVGGWVWVGGCGWVGVGGWWEMGVGDQQHLNDSALLSIMDSGSPPRTCGLRSVLDDRHWPRSVCWWVKDAVHQCWAGKDAVCWVNGHGNRVHTATGCPLLP
jgi:hypothetical protein